MGAAEKISEIKSFCEAAAYLEVRANDPWPDELWPAAKTVLETIAKEFRQRAKDIRSELNKPNF